MLERTPQTTAQADVRAISRGQGTAKLVELDAVRGIAALIVFNQHYFDNVAPVIGVALRATPLFAFVNGASAVMLFFVLSGFVLTIRPLRRGKAAALAAPVLRRWARLAGPMVVAGLFYVVAARTGAFPKRDWLPGIGAQFPPGLLWGWYLDDRDAGPVLREAAFGIFWDGAAKHNTVLWTMMWELRGSFVAFAIAASLMLRISTGAKIALCFVLGVVAAYVSPWLIGFPVGVAGAVFHIRFGDRLRVPVFRGVLITLVAVTVLAWDFGHAAGIWVWTERLTWMGRFYLWAACQSAAALGVMAVALYCLPVSAVLRMAPVQLLGVMSFPLYLTHMLTILSVGAWLCYALYPDGAGGGGAVLLYGPVLCASLLVAWPLMAFDRVWVGRLAQVSRAVVMSKE